MNGQKILIVDDETAILERLSGLLRASGWSVITASNGREALEKVTAGRPDAIVLDMIMPEMDGFQLARSLKSHLDYRNIPILAATSLCSGADRKRCLAAGCDDYVAKPFTTEQLQRSLTGLIERHLSRAAVNNKTT